MRWLTMLAIAAACASGCGDETEDSSAAAPGAEATRESVFDPLTDTLDRARGVQDTLRESEAERRRQLEQVEGQ